MKTLFLLAIAVIINCVPVFETEPTKICTITLWIDHSTGYYAPHQWYRYNYAEIPTPLYVNGQEYTPMPDAEIGTVVTIHLDCSTGDYDDTMVVLSDTIWMPSRTPKGGL